MAATDVNIITTAPERRQVARVIHFTATHAPYINWSSIAAAAAELGAHFEVRRTDAGAVSIIMFWSYAEDDADARALASLHPFPAPAAGGGGQ